MVVGVAIVNVLTVVAIPVYRSHVKSVERREAIAHMHVFEAAIDHYRTDFDNPPNELSHALDPLPNDPWENPYDFLNLLSGEPGINGKRRRDRNLNPINSDYDLYSTGPDGQSKPALQAKRSRDDSVRANDGAFIGLASEY